MHVLEYLSTIHITQYIQIMSYINKSKNDPSKNQIPRLTQMIKALQLSSCYLSRISSYISKHASIILHNNERKQCSVSRYISKYNPQEPLRDFKCKIFKENDEPSEKCSQCLGSFINHVDRFFDIFDPPSIFVDTFT